MAKLPEINLAKLYTRAKNSITELMDQNLQAYTLIDQLVEERDKAVEERDKAQAQISQLTYALSKFEENNTAEDDKAEDKLADD